MSHSGDQPVQQPRISYTKCEVKNLFTVLTAIYAHQQTISSDNVVNVTSQLQTVVSQATERVDQSSSNLAVVTTVITQIANISSQNTTLENDVDEI